MKIHKLDWFESDDPDWGSTSGSGSDCSRGVRDISQARVIVIC